MSFLKKFWNLLLVFFFFLVLSLLLVFAVSVYGINLINVFSQPYFNILPQASENMLYIANKLQSILLVFFLTNCNQFWSYFSSRPFACLLLQSISQKFCETVQNFVDVVKFANSFQKFMLKFTSWFCKQRFLIQYKYIIQ